MEKYTKIDTKEQEMSECWQLFKAGNRQAFAQIYEYYIDKLYNYGSHFVADNDLVKDAIQELFIDIWRIRENLADTTSVKYYLFRSLRRKLRLMTESMSVFVELPDTDFNEFLPNTFSHESELIEQETKQSQIVLLQKYLPQLPPRQFEAIRLSFFDGFSLKEVAAIMEMNEQSVRNLIQRSLKHLRQLVSTIVSLLFFFSKIF